MSGPTYRCPQCREECLEGDLRHEDYMLISKCCDEVVERVWMCTACGEREQHKGCEECFECLVAECIEDPRYLDMCTPELQLEIAKALATRLRPWLRQRQAA